MSVGEVLPQQFWRDRQRVRRVGRHLVFAPRFGFEAQRLHQKAHPFIAARLAVLPKALTINARRTVLAFEGGKHALDEFGECIASNQHG